MPACSVEFQFKPGDLNFKSSACEWLVVAGSTASYKGIGTVNGAGKYGFLLSATEGSPDTFGIKIWDIGDKDTVVYENQGVSIGAGTSLSTVNF